MRVRAFAAGAMALMLTTSTFGEDRVAAARAAKAETLRELFAANGLTFPPKRIYLRAFKDKGELELWAGKSATAKMVLIKSYKVAAMSGQLGPKRKLGDRQVPEGFYSIDRFNPRSQFHLSLGLNYPNASDKILSNSVSPGADIFIHGNRVSIGCLAMEDDPIQEIYLAALGARESGQKAIPVHIFPTRMDAKGMAWLGREYRSQPDLLKFWKTLEPGFRKFEKTRNVYLPKVIADGSYRF